MTRPLFAITLLSLLSYSQQMTRELKALNIYLEKKAPVEVAPLAKRIKEERGPMIDLYNQVGLLRPKIDTSSFERNLKNKKLRLRSR